jgi:putative Holliday junction resolvase
MPSPAAGEPAFGRFRAPGISLLCVTTLGIDLGRRRIGLAISDPADRVALPAGVLESGGLERDVAAVAALARERGVERVVVGLPIHMNGRRGPEAASATRFAERLAALLAIPVETLDERWTTREAERSLRETGRRGRRQRQEVDTVAATLLLRTFLERTARAGGAR